jgi:hypothetical protein
MNRSPRPQAPLGPAPDTIGDLWGVRRVGLWNFRSIEEEEDRRESRRVAAQLAGEELPEEGEEGGEGKKLFDPVAEHVSWNPMRGSVGGRAGWEVAAEGQEQGGGKGLGQGGGEGPGQGGSEELGQGGATGRAGAALARACHLLAEWC